MIFSTKKEDLTSFNYIYNNDFDFNKWYALNNKYERALTKHFQLIEDINSLYVVAINQRNIINKHTDKCLKLCHEDIKLAKQLSKFWKLENQITNYHSKLPRYESFEKASKLYEKLHRLDLSINICILALKLGYFKDGSKGGFQGRLARVLNKFNTEHNTNWQYDYEKNVLYNDDTGEILKELRVWKRPNNFIIDNK